MRYRTVLPLIAALAIGFAASAAAQTGEHGYIGALSGATFTVINSPLWAGSGGVNLGQNVQITGEVGRMQNLESNFMRDDLQAIEAAALLEEGVPVTAKADVRSFYATGGVRVLFLSSGNIRPYAAGSAGVAHLMPKPVFAALGIDVTSALLQEPDIQKVFATMNRPLASVGGGISFTPTRHLLLDVGYKYSRIFIPTTYLQIPTSPHQHDGINVHRLYAGAGYLF
jgi:opacity protein-like surface antigen